MASYSFAQQASLEGTKLLYRNFTTKSFCITSRGIGFDYRKAKFIKGKDRLFDIELVTIKDPKQTKVQGVGQDFKRYYYGKVNSAFALRIGIGNQKSLYNKEVPKAIEIKRGFAFGPVLALLKPIYVQVYQKGEIDRIVAERYDPNVQLNVLGKASFFRGISKTTINPGVFLKYYYLFDFCDDDDRITSLECGILGDFYLKGLNIMANNTARRAMLTLYISYTFGDKKF